MLVSGGMQLAAVDSCLLTNNLSCSSPDILARSAASRLSSSRAIAATVAIGASINVRGLATVQDPPKKTHGGLRDQDRIFQNVYMRHDHLLKGAKVRAAADVLACIRPPDPRLNRLEETGTRPVRSSKRDMTGLFPR